MLIYFKLSWKFKQNFTYSDPEHLQLEYILVDLSEAIATLVPNEGLMTNLSSKKTLELPEIKKKCMLTLSY